MKYKKAQTGTEKKGYKKKNIFLLLGFFETKNTFFLPKNDFVIHETREQKRFFFSKVIYTKKREIKKSIDIQKYNLFFKEYLRYNYLQFLDIIEVIHHMPYLRSQNQHLIYRPQELTNPERLLRHLV